MQRRELCSTTVVAMLVVIALSIASLFPPTCMGEYRKLMDTTPNLASSSSDDVVSLSSLYANGQKLISNNNLTSYTTANGSTTILVDIGLKAQMDHGYPLEPVVQVGNILPKRLFLIYGLESSGTTFTARTIATAIGINKDTKGDFVQTKNHHDQVHHISLPWGWNPQGRYGFKTQYSMPLPMVPVFYPMACQMKPIPGPGPPVFQPPPRKECEQIMGDQVMTRPHRFFVNMTTNIQWYRERGVRVYPIMVVRDPVLHFQGVTKITGGHCPHALAAYQQFEQGRAIMLETVERGMDPVIVSYETMLTLQRPYLQQLYTQLGISSNFFPSFRNGNTKYLLPHNPVQFQLMKEDAPAPAPLKTTFATNTFRPPSPLAQRPKGRTYRADNTPPRASQQTGAHARMNRDERAERDRQQLNGEMHMNNNNNNNNNNKNIPRTAINQRPSKSLTHKQQATVVNKQRYQALLQRIQEQNDAGAKGEPWQQ